MSRLILSDALSVLGDSTVSGYSMFPAGSTTAQKTSLINQVLERFLGMPSWKGIDVLATFAVYDNHITLPRSLQSVKKAAVPPGCGNTAVPVNNMWFQFHINGPGLIDADNVRLAPAQFVDLGMGAVTFLDPSATFKIKIVSDVNEATATNLRFFGTDANGDPVYTGTDLGVVLDADNSPATTTQVFSTLTRVVKSVSLGRIKVYAVDNATAAATLMAIYEPGETTPCYRRYAVTGAEDEDRTFTGLCKRNYVPALVSNDEVFPDNIGALKLGLMALNFETRDESRSRSKGYWQDAVQILNDELGEYLADTSPAMQIQVNAFAGAGIRNLR